MFINQNADKIQNIFVNPIILEHRPEYLPVIDKASTPVINKIKKQYKKDKKPIDIFTVWRDKKSYTMIRNKENVSE